jgi:dTDP-glucose 4,6-dehydratase
MSKTILITGGAGFVAHHLIRQVLLQTDWKVITLDRLDWSGNLNRIQDLAKDLTQDQKRRVRTVFHDLKAEINNKLVKDIGPVDIIAHLAAGSHVTRSITNPMEFVLDNVVGTCNILEFAKAQPNLERFLYFSTDEVFGPAKGDTKHTEHDSYNCTNPYSASKAGGEELAVAFQNTYNLPVYITHTMNVFGERQHPEKFIPMTIRKIRDGETVSVHTDSTKTVPGSRHYVHADDVADAMLFLLQDERVEQYKQETGIKCPKFNICSSIEIDNLEMAQIIADAQGVELKYDLVDAQAVRPGHDLRYALSGELMKKLGWEAGPVREQLAETVKWSLDNSHWLDI